MFSELFANDEVCKDLCCVTFCYHGTKLASFLAYNRTRVVWYTNR
jgi:hypothetical protein